MLRRGNHKVRSNFRRTHGGKNYWHASNWRKWRQEWIYSMQTLKASANNA